MPKVSTKTPEQQAAAKAEREAAKIASFKKLGTARLNKALDAISKLDPLGNKSAYTYTDAQVEVIKNALQNQCIKTLGRFAPGAVAATPGVEL